MNYTDLEIKILKFLKENLGQNNGSTLEVIVAKIDPLDDFIAFHAKTLLVLTREGLVSAVERPRGSEGSSVIVGYEITREGLKVARLLGS